MFRAWILYRYVALELLRVFLFSLVIITGIFVILVVVGEAIKHDLQLSQILRLVPLVIPVTFPYTVPATALFAASMVYGRLGGDNEILAVKASGLSPMIVIWPALAMAALLSVACYGLLIDVIPQMGQRLRSAAPEEFEDLALAQLRTDKFLKDKRSPYWVAVDDVKGRTLVGATFFRAGERGEQPELIAQAATARFRFDMKSNRVLVHMTDGRVTHLNEQTVTFTDREFEVPLSKMSFRSYKPKDLTRQEILDRIEELQDELQRRRQEVALEAGMAVAQGRWMALPAAEAGEVRGMAKRTRKAISALRTEQAYRQAIAVGTLAFVLLGVPVAILLQQRDFLSAFGACFLPIIGVYYPLVIGAKRLASDGVVSPTLSLWVANVVLVAVSIPFYRRVLRR